MNLKNNEKVIVQKAHKGNGVMVTDRMSYIVKIEELLSDRSKFIKVEFNFKYKVNHKTRHLLDINTKLTMKLDIC